MDQRPEQPPEGRLIADAANRLDLSIREAARRAGISYGRWRQITAGYQNVSPGSFAPVHAPARTLAKMAQVVGVTPEQMERDGQRPDAAEILRDFDAPAGRHRDGSAPRTFRAAGPRRLPGATPEMQAAMQPYLDEIEARAEVAENAHPGEPLTGSMMFPSAPHLAAVWDDLARDGLALETVMHMTAAWQAWEAEKARSQGKNSAAGLNRITFWSHRSVSPQKVLPGRW